MIDFKTSQFQTASGANAPLGAYQVDTGDPANPVQLDFNDYLLDVQAAGALTIQVGGVPVAALLGTFFVNIDGSGFGSSPAPTCGSGPT